MSVRADQICRNPASLVRSGSELSDAWIFLTINREQTFHPRSEMGGKRVFLRVTLTSPRGVTSPTTRAFEKRCQRLHLPGNTARGREGIYPAAHKPNPGIGLWSAVEILAELLGCYCEFAAGLRRPGVRSKKPSAREWRRLLLENVRFHAEEVANDEGFSRQLAALCDGLFVCDAFGSAHRAHALAVELRHGLPLPDFWMSASWPIQGKALSNSSGRSWLEVKGAKVSDKIEVVENLMRVADSMLIGGVNGVYVL